MKPLAKIYLIFGCIAVAALMVTILWTRHEAPPKASFPGYQSTDYTLNNHRYHLLVADTDAKREKGLMYVRSLPGYDGMIFTFPDSEVRNFWNQNTFRNLDVYWVRDHKLIARDELPSVETSNGIVIIASPEPADTVLEIIRP